MSTGWCGGCGEQFQINLNGVIRFHTRDDLSECRGSQQPPAEPPKPLVWQGSIPRLA